MVKGRATLVPVAPKVHFVQLAALAEAVKLVRVAVLPVLPDWATVTVKVLVPQVVAPEQLAVMVETVGDAVPVVPAPGRKTPFPEVIVRAPAGVMTTVAALVLALRAMRPNPGLFVPGLAEMVRVCAADAAPAVNRQAGAMSQKRCAFFIL
jgi:hypothetical protein